jgi:hypothetical protein
MYKTTLSEESINYIEEQVELWPINKSRIAKEIIELFWEVGTVNSVRKRVEYLCKQIGTETDRVSWEMEDAVEKLNEEITPEEPKYEIIEDWDRVYFLVYTVKVDRYWQEQRVPHKLPVEDYDKTWSSIVDICYDFSTQGANMTQLEVMKKHKLRPELRHKIKSAVPLYKKSDPTPDVIRKILRDQKWEGWVEDFIEEQAEKSIDQYKHKAEKARERRKNREVEKAIMLVQNFDYRMWLVKEASKGMKELDAPPKITHHPEETDGHLTVTFADLHLWEKTSEVIKNLQRMTQTLVNRPEKNINMLCLWDLVETLVIWGMHIWQVERMDGKYWIKLIREVVRSLERVIKTLEENGKVVNFHWIPWNHDRLGKGHNEDPDRTWALVIYEMLLLRLQNLEAEVTYYEERVNSLILWNIEYIFAHWEDWFDRRAEKRPTEVFWENSDKQAKHRVILYGHLHNFSQQNPSKDSHVIRLPAMHPGWHYSKQINKSANSGFVIIKEGKWDIDFITKMK